MNSIEKINSMDFFRKEVEVKYGRTVFIEEKPIEGVKFRIYSPLMKKFYDREVHSLTNLSDLENHLKRGLLFK